MTLLSDFDYALPPDLIAQHPLAERDSSRMMVLNRTTGTFHDRTFRDLPHILEPGDLLVFNNTRVFPARLLGRRQGTGAQQIGKNNPRVHEFLRGEAELLLIRNKGSGVWQGLVHPGRKIREGEVLVFGGGELQAEVLERGRYGLRRLRLTASSGTVEEQIERLGHVPLPPYVHRSDDLADRETYQTVYAKVTGAVAAPTAGLHFSPRSLEGLRERGIETCEITLHVGPGTFRPVRAEQVEEHKMDAEWFSVPQDAAAAIQSALDQRRRVIAVGTTCTRTLEHVAHLHDGRIVRASGETDLFIRPGFEFKATKALLTNFHLPRSTLLMLVCAFAGRELTLRAYAHAIVERYRFYSYGDCMLIL
ncbi:MAG TPA: tRNA preQ1(34) S-adenosylmethionine ribosyltransferase-isomerase QueA [Terriglobia bacterium]|nr:tRNA preQ1(34) S-adenosylmethionine ribosyltransferase-isomerase QueA [Terriglobia bacterium]